MKLYAEHEEDKWFRLISDASGAAVLVLSGPRPVLVTDAAERLTGYSKEQLLQLDFTGLFYPEARPAIASGCQPGPGETYAKQNLETRLLTRSGAERWVFITLGPVIYMGTSACLATMFDITDRKLAENALLENEASLARAQHMANLGNWQWDVASRRIVKCSAEFYRILGTSPGKLRTWDDLLAIIHPGDRDRIVRIFRKAVTGEKALNFDCRILLPGKRERIVHAEGEVTYDEAGKPLYTFGTLQDITGRKKAEQALIMEKRFSDAIVDSILGVFYVLDTKGNFVRDNRYHQAILGYSEEEILQMNALETIAEEDRDMIAGKIKEVFQKGFTTASARILTRDGRKIPFLFTGYPAEIAGKPYLVGMGVDISERVKAEEALRESEEKFRVLADTSPAAILVYQDEEVKYANDNAARLSGFSREELMKRKFWEGVHPDHRDITRERGLARQRGENVPSVYEIKTVDKSGHEHWDILSSGLIEYEGRPAVIVTLLDITDRKNAEIALRESEEKFRVLADTSTAGILVYREGRFVYVNRSMEQISGYPREELLKFNIWDWVHPDYRQLVRERETSRQIGEQVPSGYEVKVYTKAGRERWILISAGHVVYEGKHAGLATIFDITDRKHAEEALEEAKNQAELFLDLMGHDISNMNQISVGYLEMAREVIPLDAASQELISKPLETLYDSSRLIADVNKLQRITTCEIKLEETDVGKVLHEVADAYRSMPTPRVAIRHLQLEECPVLATDMLYDVFSNLIWDFIRNAEGGNTLDIRLARECKVHPPRCVVFIDCNGQGLSDQQKIRLFERPRKGMKRTGGRGIGLYLARSIVDRLGGTLTVEDLVPGDYKRGTRFIIALPACR